MASDFQRPSNYDTGPMEAGHKPVKVAAKVTQKKEDTFEKQTNQRLMEKHLLNLALEEIRLKRSFSLLDNTDLKFDLVFC